MKTRSLHDAVKFVSWLVLAGLFFVTRSAGAVDPPPDRSIRFKDLLSSARYIREGNELLDRGLYLDLKPWSYHVFDLEIIP